MGVMSDVIVLALCSIRVVSGGAHLIMNNTRDEGSEGEAKLIDPAHHRDSYLLDTSPIEVYYHVRITAKVKKETKTILQRQSGLLEAGTFTAILGPSGSGKTTLLNFLSGRLMSDNLGVEGEIRLNSVGVESVEPYSRQIGYVMQEDALLGMLTPRECFQFACDLKLAEPAREKGRIVEDLIRQLSLGGCADTKVGNMFIKGISGGERKRTSIGVELITNPSIIFLDEPTTGLDSTTALQVILLLKQLAQDGKTVISTIHQPSSELFCEFDRLMLLVEGRCIFLGRADDSYAHFERQGFTCPKLMNASEFYLDMMSVTEAEDLADDQEYEEARLKHDQQVLKFESFYLQSSHHRFRENPDYQPVPVGAQHQLGIVNECLLVLRRALVCQLRNPMDVFFKTFQSAVTALIVLLVFGYIGPFDSIFKLQNYRGLIFFLVANNAFGGIQGTLGTFSSERPVFLRERFSKSYRTVTYFLARTAINFPFELIYPTVGCVITYWATGFGSKDAGECFKLVAMVNCCYFASASYGLLYAAVIPRLEAAMALVPVLIIPFMLLGGFFINLDDVHDVRVIFYPIMYISPFKYGFQGGMDAVGISTDIEPRTPPGLLHNCLILIGIGLAVRLVSVVGMQVISNPKRPTMAKLPPEEQESSAQISP